MRSVGDPPQCPCSLWWPPSMSMFTLVTPLNVHVHPRWPPSMSMFTLVTPLNVHVDSGDPPQCPCPLWWPLSMSMYGFQNLPCTDRQTNRSLIYSSKISAHWPYYKLRHWLYNKLAQWPYYRLTSPSADVVQLYVNVQFKVKPLCTGTSSSRTNFFSFKNACMDPPKVCTKFGVSSTSLS